MKVGQIIFDQDAERLVLDGQPLHCGDTLEVLIVNGLDGQTQWLQTRVEVNDEGWYLVGLFGYQISGLFARF